jgi:hypothetical protein
MSRQDRKRRLNVGKNIIWLKSGKESALAAHFGACPPKERL